MFPEPRRLPCISKMPFYFQCFDHLAHEALIKGETREKQGRKRGEKQRVKLERRKQGREVTRRARPLVTNSSLGHFFDPKYQEIVKITYKRKSLKKITSKMKGVDDHKGPCCCEGVASRRRATPSQKHSFCARLGFQRASYVVFNTRDQLKVQTWKLRVYHAAEN